MLRVSSHCDYHQTYQGQGCASRVMKQVSTAQQTPPTYHAPALNTDRTCSAARRARCCHICCAALFAGNSAASALESASAAPFASGGSNGENLHFSFISFSDCRLAPAPGSRGVNVVAGDALKDPDALGRGLMIRACGLVPGFAGGVLTARRITTVNTKARHVSTTRQQVTPASLNTGIVH
jgi:hypothetical protein